VVDATTNEPASKTLQAAIVTAQPGDTLKVYGTCHGTNTINENLNVAGQNDPAFGAPTLVGDGARRLRHGRFDEQSDHHHDGSSDHRRRQQPQRYRW
jgi:hypothetical protein